MWLSSSPDPEQGSQMHVGLIRDGHTGKHASHCLAVAKISVGAGTENLSIMNKVQVGDTHSAC